MGALLSKKKSGPEVTPNDMAVLQLKQQRDKLRQYRERIGLLVSMEKSYAEAALREGKKKQALLFLKKRKYQESLLEKTETQLSTLNEMVSSIRFAELEVQVVEGLRVGNNALAEIHKELNIDDIEEIRNNTIDALAYQDEIDALMSSALTEEDNDAVLAELQDLIVEANPVSDSDTKQNINIEEREEDIVKTEEAPVAKKAVKKPKSERRAEPIAA